LKADTLAFDGHAIRLGDLRDNIITQKNILKSPAYTLEITNAQTKEVYNDDEVMVPKNSSVIVKRVPVQRLAPVTGQEGMSKEEEELTELAFDTLSKTANLAGAKATEENKILAMMRQSTEDFDPSTYKKTPPATYVCHRCGKKGQHYVKTCPTIGDARFNTKIMSNRTPSGIPKEYYARRVQQENEMIERLRSFQDKNSRFSPVVGSDIVDQSKVPAELQCPICQQLFTDVVVTPCCGKSYCDDCIRNYLIKNDIVCVCGETTSPDNLIPNKSLRTSVDNFRNQKQSELKSVPFANVAATAGTYVTYEAHASPQHATEIQQLQQPPDLHSDHSQNGVPSPAPQLSNDVALNSPKKPENSLDSKLDGGVMVPQDPKAGIVVSQIAPTVLAPQVVVAASLHQPTMLTGSVAQHVLPGSQNFAVGPQNVVYTHGAQTSLRHPGYTNYMPHQTFMQQQPGMVGPGIRYGTINIAPGHTIVKRFVPVPVGPRIDLAQANLRLQFAQQQKQNENHSHPDIVQEQLDALRSKDVTRSRKERHGVKSDVESPMPLTEDEFYLWQKQAMKGGNTFRPTERHRRVSPSEERSDSRTRYQSGSRSRSRSPSKRKRRREKDGSGEDSSADRRKARDKTKKKSEHRKRDSSQDSTSSKSRSRAEKKASKLKSRHLPEHIKREVDEFDFDNELEFDEELRKLGKQGGSSDEKEVSGKGESVDRSRSNSVNKSKSRSVTPMANEQERDDKEKSEENKVLEKSVEKQEAKQETDIQNDNNEVMQKEHKDVEQAATAAEIKPKKKTKIIKRKVTRIIKVRRKKSSLSTSEGAVNLVTPDGVSKEIVKSNPAESNNVKDNRHKNEANSKENETSKIKENNDKKSEVNEKKADKRKTDSQDKMSSPTKKLKSSSQSLKVDVERRKALLRKKAAAALSAKNKNSMEISPSKVEQTTAEVRAKKEAEKRALLEKAKRIQRAKIANETVKNSKEIKLSEVEEKRIKRENYKQKQKRARERERLKLQEEAKENEALRLEALSKKPDQQFYKPGEAKLKSLSEMTKKRLKQGDVRLKQGDVEGKKHLDEEEIDEGDVLKSKVTSIKKIITPEKKRRLKTSISEEERKNHPGEDHRRVVKVDTKKRNLSSTVEKINSKENSDRESYESRRRVRESDSESQERERRTVRRRQREEEESRHEAKEKKRRQQEKERTERKRISALEQEKQESYEREQQALREKEKLERKLLKQQQKFDDMIREKEDEEKRKLRKNQSKRKSTNNDSDEGESSKTRGKKSKKPGYIIQIVDSEKSESEDEDTSEESEKEKKHKKKSKHKKDRKKSSKKKKSNESENEESDESSEESEEEEEEERKKKKKKKHKSRKHKKRSKNKKHKKSKSKKKKSKRKETSSEEEDEDSEEESGKDEEPTEESTEEDQKSAGESDDKQSDTSDVSKTDDVKKRKVALSAKDESKITSEKERKKKKRSEEVSSTNDENNTTIEKDKRKKKRADVSDSESITKDEDSDVAKPSKSPLVDKIENDEVALDYTITEPSSADDNSVKKRRETTDGEQDIELDYNEDLTELDDDVLYGDLNFADDEQTNPDLTDEDKLTRKASEEYEEGEILEDDLFAVASEKDDKLEQTVETSKKTVEKNDNNNSETEKTLDDLFDTNIDKAVDDAMNELSDEKKLNEHSHEKKTKKMKLIEESSIDSESIDSEMT